MVTKKRDRSMADVTLVGSSQSLSGTGSIVLDGMSVVVNTTTSGLDGFGNPKLTSVSSSNGASPARSATLSLVTNDAGEEQVVRIDAGMGAWDAFTPVMTIDGLSLAASFDPVSIFGPDGAAEVERILNLALLGDDNFTISGFISKVWGDIELVDGLDATFLGSDTMTIGALSLPAGVDRPIFHGDAREVSFGAAVVAGDDIIDASNAGISVTIYGDFGKDNRSSPRSSTFGDDVLIGGIGDDFLFGDSRSAAFGGDDILRGGAGNDTLVGGGGDDRFFGGTGSNVFVGGSGSDTVSFREFFPPSSVMIVDLANPARNQNLPASSTFRSIENITGRQFNTYARDKIYGTDDDNVLRSGGGISNLHGRGGDDRLVGSFVFDRLFGGTGNDILIGRRSEDFFVFDTKLDPERNVDRIRGFEAIDSFMLDDRVFDGISAKKVDIDFDNFGRPRSILDEVFEANSGGVAKDENDRIIYDTDSGRLYYDPDGSGGERRVLFAKVRDAPSIDADDFFVI